MIGNKHKGALAAFDERKSKLRLALSVSRKSAEEVTHAITQMLEPIKDVVLSNTLKRNSQFKLLYYNHI
ncbi:hypothetical protein [Thorsellia kenyensis]|uniref:Uncharacterized protein n=1 Tax=Thorsellia kenyensis TaxID=1549888 RepID=A0ABV6C9X0_9GAMM